MVRRYPRQCAVFTAAPRLWDTGYGAVTPVQGPGLKTSVIAAARKIVPAHLERALRRPFANKAYVALSED